MTSTGDDAKSKLGPTIFTPIKVNGVSTTALVDTGSPATIISLEFVMSVLVGQRTPDQTPSQWQQATREKFSHPDITLHNYGGHRLDITAQMGVTLTRGKSEVNAVVLVQKGAPNNLLLGTDLQRQLGFSLLVGGGDGRATDLLSGQQ